MKTCFSPERKRGGLTWCLSGGLVLALLGSSGCIMTEDTIARAKGTYSTGKPQEPPPKAQPLYYGLVPFAFVGDMCVVVPVEAIASLSESHKYGRDPIPGFRDGDKVCWQAIYHGSGACWQHKRPGEVLPQFWVAGGLTNHPAQPVLVVARPKRGQSLPTLESAPVTLSGQLAGSQLAWVRRDAFNWKYETLPLIVHVRVMEDSNRAATTAAVAKAFDSINPAAPEQLATAKQRFYLLRPDMTDEQVFVALGLGNCYGRCLTNAGAGGPFNCMRVSYTLRDGHDLAIARNATGPRANTIHHIVLDGTVWRQADKH